MPEKSIRAVQWAPPQKGGGGRGGGGVGADYPIGVGGVGGGAIAYAATGDVNEAANTCLGRAGGRGTREEGEAPLGTLPPAAALPVLPESNICGSDASIVRLNTELWAVLK